MARDLFDERTLLIWLGDAPRETGAVVAARAILRALPASVHLLTLNRANPARLMVPVFRGAAHLHLGTPAPTDAVRSVSDVLRHSQGGGAKSPRIAATRATASALYRALSTAHVAERHAAQAHAEAVGVAATACAGSSLAWQAITADVEALKRGLGANALSSRALWPTDRCRKLAEERDDLERTLSDREGERWDLWLTWLAAREDGGNGDAVAMREVLTIPETVWSGPPGAANAHAADIHALNLRAEPTTEEARDADASLLESVQLRAALADFEFDFLAQLLRLVPFAEDMAPAGSAAARDREDVLSTLAELGAALADDIDRREGNSPDHVDLAMALRSYAEEAARPPVRVRARYLSMRGADLNDARLDEEIYDFLPKSLRRKLDRIVDLHLDLMRMYFSGALARVERLSEVDLGTDITLQDLFDYVRRAVEIMEGARGHPGAHFDPEAIAVVRNQAQELGDLIARLDRLSPAERSRDERALWPKAKGAALTVFRGGLKARADRAAFAELADGRFGKLLDEMVTKFFGDRR